jgi:WD40 repeat protein
MGPVLQSGEQQPALLLVYRGHTARVNTVAFSPNGLLVASASQDKTIQEWERATGKLRRTYQGHASWVLGVAYSPDGMHLASIGPTGCATRFQQTSSVV